MPVSQNITLKTFKFLALFVALVVTIDIVVTSGGFKGSGPPLPKPEKYKKTLQRIKIFAATGARSISCSDLTVKYSVGVG